MMQIDIAPGLKRARKAAGLSQEEMAERLHVTGRTIRAVEKGDSEVTVNFALSWLDECGVNPLPFFRAALHPEIYKVDERSSLEAIRAAVVRYIAEEAGEMEIRQLFFAMHGAHGSSWIAWLQKGMADLHNPLPDRYNAVELIRSSYLRAERLGTLVCPDEALPVMSLLDAAIDNSRDAIYSGRSTYSGAVNRK